MKVDKDQNNIPFVYEGRDLEAMSFAPKYHHWILDHFSPFVGNKIIEVGAGTGTFSNILFDRFKKPLTMIEPSLSMGEILKNRLSTHNLWDKSEFFTDFTSNITLAHKADTFFYINVLEHIENDVDELRWMHENLEKNGHVCLFSPALPALFGTHDKQVGHFRRYYLSEIKKKAESVGFKTIKAIYFDIVGVPLWWLNFVILKGTMKPSAVSLFDNVIVPMVRKLEPSSWLPFGKNVLYIGQK